MAASNHPQRAGLPSCGIVIVGYLSAGWLKPCLDSLLPDLPSNWMVIYVDNDSPDHGDLIAREYGRVDVIKSQQNVGFGRACNLGAHAAIQRGVDALIFLNPDVRVGAAPLIQLVRDLQTNLNVGIIGPFQVHYEPAIRRYNEWSRRIVISSTMWPPTEFDLAPMPDQQFSQWLDHNRGRLVDVAYVNGAIFALTVEVFLSAGEFEPLYFLYFDEVDLCRRVRALGLRTVLNTDLAVPHAWGGITRSRLAYHWYRSRTLYTLLEPRKSLLSAVAEVASQLPHDIRRPPFGTRRTAVAGLLGGATQVMKVRRARRALAARPDRPRRPEG